MRLRRAGTPSVPTVRRGQAPGQGGRRGAQPQDFLFPATGGKQRSKQDSAEGP